MKEFEDDDPMQLQAISFPEGDPEAQAATYIEEFLAMGMPADDVLGIFCNPFYLGTHRLYQKLGKERIRELIAAQYAGIVRPGATGRQGE